MSNLNSKKVETLGDIFPQILSRNLQKSGIYYLKIYEITKYFSDNLKLAVITPVFEKRDPGLVENYKPFSVLPCVSKIFERIIQQ